MAILKAAAVIGASLTISASCCCSLFASSSPQNPSLHSSPHVSHSLPNRSAFLRNSHPFHSVLGNVMAVSGSISEQNVSDPTSMDNNQPQGQDAELPEIMTEFMVELKCQGCVSSVRNKLEPIAGVKKVDVDLPNQVVRVQGSVSLKALNAALEQTGRKAKLIGQGSLDDFRISAAVAEFKGPEIYGVVRFAQVNMELARIEGTFTGLSQGPHGWSINEYGDLTRGAASTGKIYNPSSNSFDVSHINNPLGDLGTLIANRNGEAEYSGSKPLLKVADLVGRSLVVYKSEDKHEPGIAAAVIARSAGVGENYKKLCTCDGTVIWDATDNFL